VVTGPTRTRFPLPAARPKLPAALRDAPDHALGHAPDAAPAAVVPVSNRAVARLLAGPAVQRDAAAAAAASVGAPALSGPAQMLMRAQQAGGDAMTSRLLRSSGDEAGTAGPNAVAERIIRRLGRGGGLGSNLLQRYEPAAGRSLGDVRVHRDAEAADLAQAVGARAFTTGSDVFFAAGAYQPYTRDGAMLLAHELVHTTQTPVAPAGSGLTVSDPGDRHELSAAGAAARWVSGLTTTEPAATRPAGVSRQAAGGTSGAPAEDIPERYRGLVRPSLDDADTAKLQQATGGAGLVELIKRRDEIRSRLAELGRGVDEGRVDDRTAFADYDRLAEADRELTSRIQPQLAELGVASEAELVKLVEEWFPNRFLAEAKQVALDMLTHNEDEAKGELERYSAMVCSPDIDGLLAADKALGEIFPQGLIFSIQVAEEALSKYAPPAGVLTPEEFAKNIPENEQSVMVEIANLDRNKTLVQQRLPIYNATRYSYGRTYPILLTNEYTPGSFSKADPMELGKLVAGPVKEVLENIDRVRDAINDDDLKVWNMRDVLRITQERLGVKHETLLAAVDARIKEIQSDEAFLGWVKAALAITTTIVAGLLFTPAAGAAVAAAWGAGALYGSIGDYLDESAANYIALDPAVADLSLNEPSLVWVLLDAAFLLIDLAPVAKALRPAARTLAANPDAVALAAFRREAAERLGEDAAAQLTARAATRFGIAQAGLQIAEEQLARARTILAGLDLSDDAIARVLAKGADVNQVKGQLFEEVMHVDVARRMAAGASDVLGVADTAGLEVIQGHRITDLAGLQLTDGIIARRLPNGTLEIVTVLEAKAGKSAAQGLRTASKGIGDPEEFARFVIEENRAAVVKVLRKANLTADAEAVAKGGETLSDAAIEAVSADKGLRKTVTQAELGGQVRRDVERLSPNVSKAEDIASHLDEVPMQVLVDGVPTTVRISPTKTRFVGVVPEDVATDAITRSLQGEGFSFSAIQTGGRAADLASRAERLIAEQATAAAH